jgi:hypothetical protein
MLVGLVPAKVRKRKFVFFFSCLTVFRLELSRTSHFPIVDKSECMQSATFALERTLESIVDKSLFATANRNHCERSCVCFFCVLVFFLFSRNQVCCQV